MKNILEASKEELLAIENFQPTESYNGFVIVPTGEMHYGSGYGCMKFILTQGLEIVGAIGGGSDVVHLNGIGGYGLNHAMELQTQMVPRTAWSIDLLPNGCIRLFTDHKLKVGDFCLSDFEIFDTGRYIYEQEREDV